MNERQPIASREARIQRDDGTISPVFIDLYAPEPISDSEWQCRYRVRGLRRRAIDEASVGIDGIQAIHLAIQQIASWIAVAKNEPGQQVQWPEGSTYDNLEHYASSCGARRNRYHSREEAILDWEIEAAFYAVGEDPDGAEHAFKRLRRRAIRRGSDDEVIRCLYGLLAVARKKQDTRAALRLIRTIVVRQPSLGNLLTCARELQRLGHDEEARVLYERVLPQLEKDTSLHRFVQSRLAHAGRR